MSEFSSCLSRATLEEDAYTRIKLVLQWYLSGFYKKPKVRSGWGGRGCVSAPPPSAVPPSPSPVPYPTQP